MTARNLIIIATLGSVSLLLGAFAFQYIGGLAPCKMCLWQRWPHGAAIVIGVLAVVSGRVQLAWLGMLAALTTAGIGVYHTGVERGWWEGPSSCTGGGEGLGDLTGGDLLNFDKADTVVMCDEVAWEMFGLSMASWNATIAFSLAAIWLLAALSRDDH